MDHLVIRDTFDRRASRYDGEDHWRQRLAERAVWFAALQAGSRVLDIATGTGFAALYAAEKVGPKGEVLGIDISSQMLAEAERRRRELVIENARFELRDGHDVASYGKRFDAILCVSAMAYFDDAATILKNWSSTVRAGGRIAFTALEEDAFVSSAVFSRHAAAAEVSVPDLTGPLSSEARCLDVCKAAGLRKARVSVETLSATMGSIEATWQLILDAAAGEAVRNLPAETLSVMRDQFAREIATLVVDGQVVERPRCEFITAIVP